MTDTALPWTCFDCGKSAAAQGACAGCGQGPLLDARDPEIRQGMVEDDRLAASKRDRVMIAASIPVAMVLWGALSLIGLVNVNLPGLIATAGMAFGISRLLLHLFPARQRFNHLR